MQQLNYKNFKTGVVISLAMATLTLACSFIIGKNNLFLLLNNDLGKVADYFFAAWTNLGDGLVWVAVLIILLLIKRRDVLPLTIAAFIWSTIFTQVCKYLIVPDEPRPIKAITDHSLIHTVPGVELYTISSFPSGHTTTAFTIYLLFCLILPQKWWLAVGFLYAVLVAYSRIYLAEHFPLDTGAGMLVGIVSVSLSLPVQQWWIQRQQKKAH